MCDTREWLSRKICCFRSRSALAIVMILYWYTMDIIILVEMLNIVGERERPNLGFARDVRAV